jgi:hypothetical protein
VRRLVAAFDLGQGRNKHNGGKRRQVAALQIKKPPALACFCATQFGGNIGFGFSTIPNADFNQ